MKGKRLNKREDSNKGTFIALSLALEAWQTASFLISLYLAPSFLVGVRKKDQPNTEEENRERDESKRDAAVEQSDRCLVFACCSLLKWEMAQG